jgi:hypothetical protein
MRFYGRGIVWDKENDRTLMKFVDGEFETDDPRITELLLAGGYKHDGKEEAPKIVEVLPDVPAAENVAESVADEVPAQVTADIGVKELRELGKQRGLAFKPGTTKIDMAKAINAK